MAEHRHKRETNARRTPPAIAVLAPLAVLATAAAVTIGVSAADPGPGVSDITASASSSPLARATPPVTRSESRTPAPAAKDPAPVVSEAPSVMSKTATRKAIAGAKRQLWTTEELNLWNWPGDKATQIGLVEAGTKVLVTGRALWGRTEIVVKGESRWVTDGYLSAEKPPALGGECTNGSSVASGVSEHIVRVHQAVCANFPEISSYGTLRGGGGDHGSGRAVDIMVSGELGWAVADFLRANYTAFGISYIIYSQQIWSVERGGEGWRGMSDRGSATANHYDHVHVSVF